MSLARKLYYRSFFRYVIIIIIIIRAMILIMSVSQWRQDYYYYNRLELIIWYVSGSSIQQKPNGINASNFLRRYCKLHGFINLSFIYVRIFISYLRYSGCLALYSVGNILLGVESNRWVKLLVDNLRIKLTKVENDILL